MKLFVQPTRVLALLWSAFFLSFFSASAHAEEFLEPQVAFKFSARAVDANTLEARWQIADRYYMYRDKFKFSVEGATLGTPKLPPGKMKVDETFGNVEVYRKDVRILLPIQRTSNATAVTLTATSQGCADAGLCYTPITETKRMVLPSAPPTSGPAPTMAPPLAAATSSGPATTALTDLRSLGGDNLPQLLPPDEAFKVNAQLSDVKTVRMDYHLTPDTYLYRDKLAFAIKAPEGITVVQTNLPDADVKDDPTFGRTEVYHRDFSATLTLSRALATNEKLVLNASYQGCNDKVGVCYPPLTRAFTLATGSTVSGASVGALATDASTASPPATPESDTSRIERVLRGGSFWAVVASFFGFGLLLSLTPCVFPMIPILSGIIAGQKKLTKTSGFFLALAYVLGMAITYALAGVAAALSGTLISNALQNPWALGIGALIFVALAMSMFGFFELQLPNAIQSKFSDTANRMKGGSVVGVFTMGALSAVIVGPCVAPPLAAALAFIAQTGNTVLGGAALFVLALGMGVPLLLIGLSAGALLPKAGGWMTAVKYFFGVLMLAIAIYLISPIIPQWVNMLLWALLLIGSAIYLHALDPLPPHASGWARLWKGLGVILLISGLAILLGMFAGSRDLLQPLAIYQGRAGTASSTSSTANINDAHLKFERVKSVAELDAKIAASKGKEVMLDFYADWCVSCKEMERFTFADPKVQARFKDMVLLQADVTANNADDKALLKRFNLFGPPGIIFWDGTGKQSTYKVIGYEPPEKFLASMSAALGR